MNVIYYFYRNESPNLSILTHLMNNPLQTNIFIYNIIEMLLFNIYNDVNIEIETTV